MVSTAAQNGQTVVQAFISAPFVNMLLDAIKSHALVLYWYQGSTKVLLGESYYSQAILAKPLGGYLGAIKTRPLSKAMISLSVVTSRLTSPFTPE